MPYNIKHDDVRLADIGTLTEPHLYCITAGQRNNLSLLFHIKIGLIFHILIVNKVNKSFVNLQCADKECCSRHKFKVDRKFVIVEKDGSLLKNGKTRDKLTLDFSNPEIRDCQYCTVISHDSIPHKTGEKATFFTHIHKEFREEHTELALDSLQSEVDTTLRAWNLRRYGPLENESSIVNFSKRFGLFFEVAYFYLLGHYKL